MGRSSGSLLPLRLPTLDDYREQWHEQGHVLRVTAAGPRPTFTGFPTCSRSIRNATTHRTFNCGATVLRSGLHCQAKTPHLWRRGVCKREQGGATYCCRPMQIGQSVEKWT